MRLNEIRKEAIAPHNASIAGWRDLHLSELRRSNEIQELRFERLSELRIVDQHPAFDIAILRRLSEVRRRHQSASSVDDYALRVEYGTFTRLKTQ